MNVNIMLLLATFLLVVVLGGTFGSAEKSDSFESTFVKRSNGIVERDLSTFQQQISTATYLNISTCSSYTCGGPTYSSYCPGICSKTASLFQQAATNIQNCYVQGMCGIHLLSNQLTNVNISIASGSYPGTCYITGQAVTMALTNQNVTTTTPAQSDTASPFIVKETLVYTFTGLNLHCQPAVQDSGTVCDCPEIPQNVVPPPCPDPVCDCPDIAPSVAPLCPDPICNCPGIQQNVAPPCPDSGRGAWSKVSSAYLIVSDMKRAEERAVLSKRQVTSAIDSAVTVTQLESFLIEYVFFSARTQAYPSAYRINTQVSLASAIPSQYQADITAGIASVFNDYYTFNPLQYNFYNTHADLFFNFFRKTCNNCK